MAPKSVSRLHVSRAGKRLGGQSVSPAAADHSHLHYSQVLFFKRALNINTIADQILAKSWLFQNYFITAIRLANATISLTTASGGIYTAAAKGGIALAANQALSTLTGPTTGMDLTLAAAGRDEIAASDAYFALTTAQGQAGTVDLWIFGFPMTEAP